MAEAKQAARGRAEPYMQVICIYMRGPAGGGGDNPVYATVLNDVHPPCCPTAPGRFVPGGRKPPFDISGRFRPDHAGLGAVSPAVRDRERALRASRRCRVIDPGASDSSREWLVFDAAFGRCLSCQHSYGSRPNPGERTAFFSVSPLGEAAGPADFNRGGVVGDGGLVWNMHKEIS